MSRIPNLDDVFIVNNTVIGGVVCRQAILRGGRIVELTAAALDSLFWAIKASPGHKVAAVPYAGPGYTYTVKRELYCKSKEYGHGQ